MQISTIGSIDTDDVARVCKDNQITIAGTHIKWDDFCNKTEEVIAKHKTWDCPHSALDCLSIDYYYADLDGIKIFITEAGPIIEKLNAEGIDFSYHKWIRKFPGRQPLLHLKDMSMYHDEQAREQRIAAIGEGNLDWDDILAAAKESDCRWYLVEQDRSYGRDPFDCLASSFRFLQSKGLS